jgi:hypothetical protein
MYFYIKLHKHNFIYRDLIYILAQYLKSHDLRCLYLYLRSAVFEEGPKPIAPPPLRACSVTQNPS